MHTRLRFLPATLAVTLLALTGCHQVVVDSGPFVGFMLTPDGEDDIHVSGTVADVTASAPASNQACTWNGGCNSRAIWWKPDAPASADAGGCVTWWGSSAGDPHQPGLMLWHTDQQPDGSWRSIGGLSITRNVWGYNEGPGAYTAVNTHRWDVTRDDKGTETGATFTQLEGRYLTGLTAPDGGPKAYPWRACVASTWTTFSVKVWPTSVPEPAWGTPAYGYTVTLPADLQLKPRRLAWYDGHSAPGSTARYTDFWQAS